MFARRRQSVGKRETNIVFALCSSILCLCPILTTRNLIQRQVISFREPGVFNCFCLLLSATVKLPPEKFVEGGTTDVASDPKKIILNSSEELFAEIRDKNFLAVGPVLSKKAKLISAQFDVSSFFIIPLTSGDSLIMNARNYCSGGMPLKRRLSFSLLQERHAAKTVGDIKNFVSKLPHMQAAKASLAMRKFIILLLFVYDM